MYKKIKSKNFNERKIKIQKWELFKKIFCWTFYFCFRFIHEFFNKNHRVKLRERGLKSLCLLFGLIGYNQNSEAQIIKAKTEIFSAYKKLYISYHHHKMNWTRHSDQRREKIMIHLFSSFKSHKSTDDTFQQLMHMIIDL